MRALRSYLLVRSRHRRSAQHAGQFAQRLERSGPGCGAFLAVVFVTGLVALGLAYASLTQDLPAIESLPVLLHPGQGALLQPTRLYDRSGQRLLLSLENPGIERRYLSLDPDQPAHLSTTLVRVTLDRLDPNFLRSSGFRWQDARNAAADTIAERLVDDLLLEAEASGVRRTLRMRLLAAQAVARYGQAQVLEWYLNSTYYGHLAYGAESAARLYLGKSAADLNLAEAALLVAASEAPALNPLDAPAAALERQRAVLDGLLTAGKINADEYQRARQQQLPLQTAADRRGETQAPPVAPEFTRMAIERLARQFGRKTLERGGLVILTTLDYDIQQQLTCTVRTQLLRLQGQPGAVNLPDGQPCQAALLLPTLPPQEGVPPSGLLASGVVLDPQTGEVLALLGETSVNGESATFSGHEPGSLLTPFVALAGFTRGMGPATLVWDMPDRLPVELSGRSNPDGNYRGPLRLRTALNEEALVPLAQLLVQIGPNNVWRMAEPLGLGALESAAKPADLLFAGGQVTPLEMAQAYATLSTLGQRAGQRLTPEGAVDPALILRVSGSDGRIYLTPRPPDTQAVLSSQLAYLLHHILSDRGSHNAGAGSPDPLEIGYPAGAKTGQTADRRQVWAAGYTRQRLAVLWLGAGKQDNTKAHLEARMVSGVWHAIMQYMQRGLPSLDWGVPTGITTLEVCNPSGLLPTNACPERVNEVFLNGNEPTSLDNLYQAYQVNRETGRLATVFTPPELIETRTYLVVPPEAQEWGRRAGLELPPRDYDAIQAASGVPGAQIGAPAVFAVVRGAVEIRGTAAGENFASYQLQVGQGLNPQTWLEIEPQSKTEVKDGLLGTWDTLQNEEGLYALRLLVIRQNQRVDTAIIQVTVDNTPPVVRVAYPTPEQRLQLGSQRLITLRAEVSDQVGAGRVEWLVDGQIAGERAQAPYSLPWEARPGKHSLQVRVYDLAGNEGLSEMVTFYIE